MTIKAITGASHRNRNSADMPTDQLRFGLACAGSSSPSRLSQSWTDALDADPWPVGPRNASKPALAPRKPTSPAVSTITGNGTRRRKIAMNGEAAKRIVLERSGADADYSLENNGQNRRLQAKEQPFNERHVPEQHIDIAQ